MFCGKSDDAINFNIFTKYLNRPPQLWRVLQNYLRAKSRYFLLVISLSHMLAGVLGTPLLEKQLLDFKLQGTNLNKQTSYPLDTRRKLTRT